MYEVLTSKILGLEDLFQLGYFRPAAVQRDFEWGPAQSGQVLKDILDLISDLKKHRSANPETTVGELGLNGLVEGHNEPELADHDGAGPLDGVSESGALAPDLIDTFFLGNLYLYPSKNSTFEIFDGLQRLTMLTILLAVLRDRTHDNALKNRLHALIDDSSNKKYRLTHRGTRQTLPKTVQALGEAGKIRHQTTRPDWAAGKRIFDVARFFRLSLPEQQQDTITEIAMFLLDNFKISVTFIPNRRLARQNFIAINHYGVQLRRDEIFKGELLDLANNDTTANEIEGIWNTVRQKVSATEKMGGNSAGSASFQTSKFEQFLTCCDLIERRQSQSVDCLGDLITHLEDRAKKGTLTSWLGSLNTLADAWVKLEACLKEPDPGDLTKHYIWTLNFFKWQEWRPLALYWMERYATGSLDSTSQERFERLSARCMALTMLDHNAKSRSDTFLRALKLTIRGRRPFDDSDKRLPLNFTELNRTRIRDALSLPIENHEVRRSLILWYEASLWGADAPHYIREASVEHILPGRSGVGSQWMIDFPDSMDRYVSHASLGNLGLVDWDLQQDLANHDYAGAKNKKSILARDNQFAKYKCMADIAGISAWHAPVIAARTKTAAAHIWQKFGLLDPQ